MRSIVAATQADKEEILHLYKSQIGREYCPWDEHYPGMNEIEFDLSRDALFVMKESDGHILAAISLDLDEQVEALNCWSEKLRPGGEISRLAVSTDVHNQGIAREMIRHAMQVQRERGKKSTHFLVNKYNEIAIRSYAHMRFTLVGECYLYDQPFLCYEKEL